MYCENCGAFIPDDSKFCPECGKEQISGTGPAVMRCPDCGAELEPDSLFCENCGRSLYRHPAQKRDEPPVPVRPPEISIPRASRAMEREMISPNKPKPKKKSGCGTVVLIILVLIFLSAGFYFLKVYDGDPKEVISRVISGIKPAAESVLTKIPETISDITSKPTAPVSRVTAPTAIAKPKTGETYNAGDYSTAETARLQDFLWVTQDIVKGLLPAGHDRLTDFDELLGGWKAYIIDDLNGQYGSGIERLCRTEFVRDTNGNGMIFTWVYVHNTKTDEGYNDYSPPTAFYGEMRDGRFHGLGTGSIDMTDFYVLNGHEYAIGTLHWPDAVTGTVFLVRP